MTILQPFSSCIVVTVRPFSSVTDETARAVPLLPLEEEALEEEENALADDRECPERDRTLIELDLRKEEPRDADAPPTDFVLISRPLGRIRNSSQSLLFETLTSRLSPGTGIVTRATAAKAALVRRGITIFLLIRDEARPLKDRAYSHGSAGAGALPSNRISSAADKGIAALPVRISAGFESGARPVCTRAAGSSAGGTSCTGASAVAESGAGDVRRCGAWSAAARRRSGASARGTLHCFAGCAANGNCASRASGCNACGSAASGALALGLVALIVLLRTVSVSGATHEGACGNSGNEELEFHGYTPTIYWAKQGSQTTDQLGVNLFSL